MDPRKITVKTTRRDISKFFDAMKINQSFPLGSINSGTTTTTTTATIPPPKKNGLQTHFDEVVTKMNKWIYK